MNAQRPINYGLVAVLVGCVAFWGLVIYALVEVVT